MTVVGTGAPLLDSPPEAAAISTSGESCLRWIHFDFYSLCVTSARDWTNASVVDVAPTFFNTVITQAIAGRGITASCAVCCVSTVGIKCWAILEIIGSASNEDALLCEGDAGVVCNHQCHPDWFVVLIGCASEGGGAYHFGRCVAVTA